MERSNFRSLLYYILEFNGIYHDCLSSTQDYVDPGLIGDYFGHGINTGSNGHEDTKGRLCYEIFSDMEYKLYIWFCRTVSTEWMESDARKRMEEIRMLPVETHQQFLVPPTDDWSWGKNLIYNKDSLVKLVAEKIVKRKDKVNMDNFVKNSATDKIQIPNEPEDRRKFNPVEIPLLDMLAIDKDRVDSWDVPSRQYITQLQANRGLGFNILDRVEVREIVVGVTSPEKLKETIW